MSEEKGLPSLGLDSREALFRLDETLEATFARLFEDLHGESLVDYQYFVAYVEFARAHISDAWYIYAPLAYYFAHARLWRRVCEVMELCLLQQTASEQMDTYISWSSIGQLCFGLDESSALAERSIIWAERLEIEKRCLAIDTHNAGSWCALALVYEQYPGPESERKSYLLEALKCFEQAQIVANLAGNQKVVEIAKSASYALKRSIDANLF